MELNYSKENKKGTKPDHQPNSVRNASVTTSILRVGFAHSEPTE